MKGPAGFDKDTEWVHCQLPVEIATFDQRFGDWPKFSVTTEPKKDHHWPLVALIVALAVSICGMKMADKLPVLKSLSGLFEKTLGIVEVEAQKLAGEIEAMGQHGVESISVVRGKVNEARATFAEVAKSVSDSEVNSNNPPTKQG